MLRQQLRRAEVATGEVEVVVDLSNVPCEDDGTADTDIRGQLTLVMEAVRVETERLSRLIKGYRKGNVKSPEFEFASRTILATGCSARAAVQSHGK